VRKYDFISFDLLIKKVKMVKKLVAIWLCQVDDY